MSKLTKALTAAAGNAGESLYVEDVFSTYLYDGNSSTQTITNGIDLSGEGGMIWTKGRTTATDHYIADTERGINQGLFTNSTAASVDHTSSATVTAFNSDGYTLGSDSTWLVNWSGNPDYASWTFRKAEKFFDVVTWTGDGTGTRTIAHNLNGGQPGCIIVKRTDAASDWMTFNLDGSIYRNLVLNSTAAENATRTATDIADESVMKVSFMEGWAGIGNASGETYVAYLFASDAGGFGDDGSESIIKCGSYTFQYNQPNEIDVGFEPQFILYKETSNAGTWTMLDTMRGWTVEGDNWLRADASDAEGSNFDFMNPTANGFKVNNGTFGANYIYIAIRRPMKTPESGTEVFTPNSYSGNSTADRTLVSSNSPVDLGIVKKFNGNGDWLWSDRLRGAGQTLYSNYTQAESVANPPVYITGFDLEDGMEVGSHLAVNASGNNYISYMFTRATGVFDVVAYTGDGTSSRDIAHNLGAVPEFIVTKRRNLAGNWAVYHPDLGITSTSGIRLNTSDGSGYSQLSRYPSTPTSTVYTIGNDSDVNTASSTYVSYLFATLAGVSKVGSYTGTGADLDVDCGFSAGARWVMIKRYGTSTTGDWYVWDSARGIVAGNDPYVLISSQSGEVTSTDYIDPLASGFTVTSSAPAALNASGGTYIFLAIA